MEETNQQRATRNGSRNPQYVASHSSQSQVADPLSQPWTEQRRKLLSRSNELQLAVIWCQQEFLPGRSHKPAKQKPGCTHQKRSSILWACSCNLRWVSGNFLFFLTTYRLSDTLVTASVRIAGCLQQSTEVMQSLNQLMRVPQLHKIMMTMGREMEKVLG